MENLISTVFEYLWHHPDLFMLVALVFFIGVPMLLKYIDDNDQQAQTDKFPEHDFGSAATERRIRRSL